MGLRLEKREVFGVWVVREDFLEEVDYVGVRVFFFRNFFGEFFGLRLFFVFLLVVFI